MEFSLNRFVVKQEKYHKIALKELKNGRKESHWMWFIFPQIAGLGTSEAAIYYSIKNYEEAVEYFSNDYLRENYLELCEVLLNLKTDNARVVFGSIDYMKLHSSLTLFYLVSKHEIVNLVLKKYYNSVLDVNTLEILGTLTCANLQI